MGVLEALYAAGDKGLLAGDMTLLFRPRPRGRNATHIEVNTSLGHLHKAGRVQRSECKERSPYYHGTPAWRWRITPEGRAYYDSGGREGQIGTQRDRLARQAAEQRAASGQLLDAMEAAVQRVKSLTPLCYRDRNALICELRDSGLPLEFIGGLFGISRERARQVAAGIHVGRRCKCRQCQADMN